jgi:hypothetical protein
MMRIKKLALLLLLPMAAIGQTTITGTLTVNGVTVPFTDTLPITCASGAGATFSGTLGIAGTSPGSFTSAFPTLACTKIVPVNGTCGSANGVAVTAPPTTNLCATGNASAVVGTGPFTWSCTGSNGGTTATCAAPLVSSGTSACGTTIPTATKIIDASGNVWTVSGQSILKNGVSLGVSPGLKLVGYFNGLVYNQTVAGGSWYWNGKTWIGGAPAACVGTAVNGVCGSANGGTVATAPTTNLCGTGIASAVTGAGPWVWSCAGTGGGTTASCSANITSGGVGTLTGADTSHANNGTFVQSEPVVLTFATAGGATAVNITIVDENGSSLVSAAVPVSNGVATYTAPSTKLGYYRVNATIGSSTLPPLGTRPAGFITYAVVPDPATRVNYGDALSRFGMQGGFSAAQNPVIPYLGIRWVIGTPNWSQLEPNGAGQLASEIAAGQDPAYDATWAAVNYNGTPWQTYKIAQLASTGVPTWAGPVAGTGGTLCGGMGELNPAGIAGLPTFATALATEVPKDYPGQSQHFYQVTWEPEVPWCFGGTGAELEQYFQLSYGPLHAADATAQVMGPTLFYHGDEGQLASLYAAGLGSEIDAFSIHPYAAYPYETTPLIADLRAEMAQANAAAGKVIPFFGTEHGLTSAQGINELQQALGNIREEIALIGEGFIHDIASYIADLWNVSATEPNNTYGYYWNLNPTVPFGTDKIGPKPAAPAWAAMTYLLDGSTTAGVVPGLTGTQMGYKFTRGGVNTVALWDYAATSAFSLPVAAGTVVQVCTWMGNCTAITSTGTLTLTLGTEPQYLIGV